MENKITLAQSNKLTEAKYDFTKVEKNAIYIIISEVRRQYIDKNDGQRTLFDNLVVQINTQTLLKSDTSLHRMYQAMRSLRRKDLFIVDDDQALCVGYINYFKHKKGSDTMEVEVSSKILPYLVELAEYYTQYELVVALSLKNKYSQRLYEYCNQWKNTKFFTLTVEEFRERLMLEDRYKNFAQLKRHVIEPAQKELQELYDKGECGVCFTYSAAKKGRSYHQLKFFVNSSENQKKPSDNFKPEDYLFHIKNWIDSWFLVDRRPKNKTWANNLYKFLQLHPEKMKPFYDRLEKMTLEEEADSYQALVRYIVDNDVLTLDLQ